MTVFGPEGLGKSINHVHYYMFISFLFLRTWPIQCHFGHLTDVTMVMHINNGLPMVKKTNKQTNKQKNK